MDAVQTGICSTDIDVVFILSQCFPLSRLVAPISMRFHFTEDGADDHGFDCARIICCYIFVFNLFLSFVEILNANKVQLAIAC